MCVEGGFSQILAMATEIVTVAIAMGCENDRYDQQSIIIIIAMI